MSYEYRVFSRGITTFSKSLEDYGAVLSQMLNDNATRELMAQNWELWRIEKFDGHQSNHGFLIVLRRPLAR